MTHDAVPDNAQDFSFTAGGGLSPASFSLDDDLDADAREHAHVQRRAGRVRLLARRDRPCRLGSRRAPPATTAARCRTSRVSAGETVTCTFTNHKRGQVVVVKDATPDDPQDFSFTAGGGLTPDQLPARRRRQRTLSNTRTFADVPAGNGYSVSETVPGGWDQTRRHLRRRQPGVEHRRRPGETVTCTFANRKRGSIVVVKDAQPNDAQDFAFTAGGGLSPTSFSLDDDADGTLSNSRTFANVDARRRLLGLARRCRAAGTRRARPVTTAARCRTSTSRAGETVTCTFTNEQARPDRGREELGPERRAGLRVHGRRRPLPVELQPRRRLRRTLSNTHTFADVPPGGGYSVSETVPSGWDQFSRDL